MLVQSEPTRDRVVANWEHIESSAYELVDSAVASNHRADPIGGPLDRGFVNKSSAESPSRTMKYLVWP